MEIVVFHFFPRGRRSNMSQHRRIPVDCKYSPFLISVRGRVLGVGEPPGKGIVPCCTLTAMCYWPATGAARKRSLEQNTPASRSPASTASNTRTTYEHLRLSSGVTTECDMPRPCSVYPGTLLQSHLPACLLSPNEVPYASEV